MHAEGKGNNADVMSIFKEIANRYRNISTTFAGKLPEKAGKAALDLVALIDQRVRGKGENKNGSAFSRYSNKNLPNFFFVGRSRTESAESRVKQLAASGALISYKEFRGINNLPTFPKNFEFTGKMWREFEVNSLNQPAPGLFVIKFGGKTPYARDIIDWQSRREKTLITESSAKERALVVKIHITNFLKSLLGI